MRLDQGIWQPPQKALIPIHGKNLLVEHHPIERVDSSSHCTVISVHGEACAIRHPHFEVGHVFQEMLGKRFPIPTPILEFFPDPRILLDAQLRQWIPLASTGFILETRWISPIAIERKVIVTARAQPVGQINEFTQERRQFYIWSPRPLGWRHHRKLHAWPIAQRGENHSRVTSPGQANFHGAVLIRQRLSGFLEENGQAFSTLHPTLRPSPKTLTLNKWFSPRKIAVRSNDPPIPEPAQARGIPGSRCLDVLLQLLPLVRWPLFLTGPEVVDQLERRSDPCSLSVPQAGQISTWIGNQLLLLDHHKPSSASKVSVARAWGIFPKPHVPPEYDKLVVLLNRQMRPSSQGEITQTPGLPSRRKFSFGRSAFAKDRELMVPGAQG